MRASDLLGQPVLTADGTTVGVVTDLRCVQDGPLRGSLASLRLDAVLVSRHHAGSTLGYNRRPAQGPWLIRILVRRLHQNMRVIAWADLIPGDGHLTMSPNRTASGRVDPNE